MRRFLVPAAVLLAALPARAGALKPAGGVEGDTVAEVPLYGGLVAADPAWYVEVKAGEQALLLQLVTEGNEVALTEAAAGRLGVEGKGKHDIATVEALALGGVTLTDVRVHVGAKVRSGPLPVDGTLSLAGFPDLAWALLPSKGVVRVGPAARAAEVLGDLAAAPGFETPDLADLATVKVKVGKQKHTVEPGPLTVAATWSGVEHRAVWSLEGETRLAREASGTPGLALEGSDKSPLSFPDAPARPVGPAREEWREVGVAGATTPVWVRRDGHGAAYLAPGVIGAAVGGEVARRYDQGVDPAARQLRLRAAGTVTTADYAPLYEARLKAALEPAPAAEGAEAPSPEDQKKARLGAIPAYADYLHAQGRFADEVALRREVTEGEPGACAGWLGLGDALLAQGQAAEAADAYGRADALYHPWAVLPLLERQQKEKDHAKAEEKGEAWEGPTPQPHACHVAAGKVATARVLAGQPDAVDALYPARIDLDPGLARAAGAAALVRGRPEAAQAAYLQALKLTGMAGDDPKARVGLFLARGTDPDADGQLARAGLWDDPAVVAAYADALRARSEATVPALRALLAADPANPALLVGLAQAQGAEAGRSALDAARGAIAARPGAEGAVLAVWAKAAAGELDAARSDAAALTARHPGDAGAWYARGVVARAAGDAAGAREAFDRAAALDPDHPIYVLAAARD